MNHSLSSRKGLSKSVRAASSLVAPVLLASLSLVLWRTLGGTATDPLPIRPDDAISLDGLYVKGSTSASVGLILFSDFECPACAVLATKVLPQIYASHVATGRVFVAFSDLPLNAIHPAAHRRAMLAECGGRQGRFWETHDALFQFRTALSVEDVVAASLDKTLLAECLKSDADAVVRRRAALAARLRIRSTPTVVIGRITPTGLRVSEVIVGLQTPSRLAARLDATE